MASILIRGLDESVKQALAERARANQSSMEAEARAILTRELAPRNIGLALYEFGQRHGGIELDIPPRTDPARLVDFS